MTLKSSGGWVNLKDGMPEKPLGIVRIQTGVRAARKCQFKKAHRLVTHCFLWLRSGSETVREVFWKLPKVKVETAAPPYLTSLIYHTTHFQKKESHWGMTCSVFTQYRLIWVWISNCRLSTSASHGQHNSYRLCKPMSIVNPERFGKRASGVVFMLSRRDYFS